MNNYIAITIVYVKRASNLKYNEPQNFGHTISFNMNECGFNKYPC